MSMSKAPPSAACSCCNDSKEVCVRAGGSLVLIGLAHLAIAVLLRIYLDSKSLHLFETTPTYYGAITYIICGLATLAFTFETFRSYFMVKMASWLAFANSCLSTVITLGLVFVNLKVFNAMDYASCTPAAPDNSTCTCNILAFSPAFPTDNLVTFTTDCVPGVHILHYCLLLTLPVSLVGIGVSVFCWRFLNEITEQ